MKQNLKYIILFIVFAALFIYMQLNTKKEIDWSHNYLTKSKAPFGTSALYNLLPALSPKSKIEKQGKSLYETYSGKDAYPENTSTLIVESELIFDTLDWQILSDYAYSGNHVLIAASYFSGTIKDSLGINVLPVIIDKPWQTDSLLLLEKENYYLSFKNTSLPKQKFNYSQRFDAKYFEYFDTNKLSVVGVDEKDRPNLLRYEIGAGYMLISCNPDVFTNYYIVNHPARAYAYNIVSQCADSAIYWSTGYSPYKNEYQDEMSFVRHNKSLYAAWVLLFVGFLVYLFFTGKRRQRIIPIIEKPKNTSIEFVKVIAELAFNSKNHIEITRQKIFYFQDYIRSKYKLDTHELSDELYTDLSLVTNLPRPEIVDLLNFVYQMQHPTTVSNNELQKLNLMISQFMHKTSGPKLS